MEKCRKNPHGWISILHDFHVLHCLILSIDSGHEQLLVRAKHPWGSFVLRGTHKEEVSVYLVDRLDSRSSLTPPPPPSFLSANFLGSSE